MFDRVKLKPNRLKGSTDSGLNHHPAKLNITGPSFIVGSRLGLWHKLADICY
jgi:hypothetical protein